MECMQTCWPRALIAAIRTIAVVMTCVGLLCLLGMRLTPLGLLLPVARCVPPNLVPVLLRPPTLP